MIQVKFATVNGARTRYMCAGAGEPLFLLHGIGMSGDCWIRNIGPLSARHTVIAPDHSGHGFSDSLDFGSEASQVVNARRVVELAKVLGFETYNVLGSSYGGLVASLVYFQAPERVRKLALVGSASTFQSEEDQAKALRAAAALAKQALGNPSLESCRRRMQGVVHDPATIPEELLWLQLTAYAYPDREAAYEATINACIAHLNERHSRVAWRLEDLKLPVWTVVGRNDIRADWRAHQAGVGRMPRARLSIYENCGHFPFLEHADRFNSDLLAFLASE